MSDEKQSDQPGAPPGPEPEKGVPPAPKPAAEPVKPGAPGEGAKPKPPSAAAKPPAPPAKKPAVMETTPWEGDLPDRLRQQFGDQISELSTYRGQSFLVALPEAVVPVLDFLRIESEFDYLVDITAVDYPKREARFDLVYIVYSFARNERIRIKTLIAEGSKPRSAVSVHLTADWLEREVYDMFGIEFEDHPNLKRILMPDDWEGWPLRKDADILAMDNQWVRDNMGIESGQ